MPSSQGHRRWQREGPLLTLTCITHVHLSAIQPVRSARYDCATQGFKLGGMTVLIRVPFLSLGFGGSVHMAAVRAQHMSLSPVT
eukprot:1195861-Rhodomonas_salina.1